MACRDRSRAAGSARVRWAASDFTCTDDATRAHDLREPLGIVLIGLIHLHLERGTGMPRIEADHVEPAPAQFMDKPRCHRASFNPDACIIARMPPHSPLNRFRL